MKLSRGLKVLLGLSIFSGSFFSGVSVSDRWRDKELRRDVSLLSLGMKKEEVFRILGRPNREHLTPSSTLLLCYTSDSFKRLEGDCGPIAVALNSERVTKIIIAGPYPAIIE